MEMCSLFEILASGNDTQQICKSPGELHALENILALLQGFINCQSGPYVGSTHLGAPDLLIIVGLASLPSTNRHKIPVRVPTQPSKNEICRRLFRCAGCRPPARASIQGPSASVPTRTKTICSSNGRPAFKERLNTCWEIISPIRT